MRIGRESWFIAQFMAIIFHLFLADAAFQIAARINAGRCMALKINKVARFLAVVGVEKVVVANFQQRGQRRVRRNVPADAGIFLVLPMDHRHGVPADQALDAALHRPITGVRMLFLHRNGVDVRGIQMDWDVHAGLLGAAGKGVQQTGTLARTFLVNDFVKSFNPL